MTENRGKQAGFTLVEVLVWVALSLIIIAAIGLLFSTFFKAWVYGNHRYDVQQTASLVTNTMINDLRYGKTYVSAYDVNAESNQAISFTSLRDKKETIFTYYVDKSNHHLYRIPGWKSDDRELVPGQNGAHFTKITITKPSPADKMFSINGSSIDIALEFTDTSVANQTPLVVYTVVTDLKSSFEK